MKRILLLGVFLCIVLVSCKIESKQEIIKNEEVKNEFASFGQKIKKDNALSDKEMLARFKTLQSGDTINVKFSSKINEVCSKKGCWMVLGIDTEETMVRFKDYGFFMPLDSKGKEVIVEGKAFVKETSVDELRHYAEDAGKSKEEIAKITIPKKEYAFLAHGVLLK